MNFRFIKTGLAAFGMLVSLSFGAQAADLRPAPVYSKAPNLVPFYNWSGLYIGLNGAYAFGDADLAGLSAKPNGFLGGGTLGYNMQAGAIVYGIEGDFDFGSVKDSDGFCAGCDVKQSWLATVRGRLGYSFDRFLPYITGGAAFGNLKVSTPFGASDKSQVGWTAGVGIEYAFLRDWSVKAEYLYVDLGDVGCDPLVCGAKVNFNESLVRLGVNYRFNWDPISSRY